MTQDSPLDFLKPGQIKLAGWLENKIQLSMANRLKRVDYRHLVDPFRHRDEVDGRWRCEFWGKIGRSAFLAYAYSPDPAFRKILDATIADILSTQTPDGCISSYPYDKQLADWDIWGRKYVLLGLLRYYMWIEPKPEILAALRGEVDYLMGQLQPGRDRIVDQGWHGGLAASSILEPVVLVYQLTGDEKYLNYAKWIAEQGGSAGQNIFADALQGVAPKNLGNAKSYEMMSCFEGLAELYRVTGNADWKDSVVALYRAIRDQEIMVTGLGGLKDEWGEFWDDGNLKQTAPGGVGTLGETCITTTWLKYCTQVLRLTGDSTVVDEIERSLYNALAGAMTPDGSWWSHQNPTPLAGISCRCRAGDQIAGFGEDCCVANGPEGLAWAPWIAVMAGAEGPAINLYEPAIAEVPVSTGQTVRIQIESDYPRRGEVVVHVTAAKPCAFTLRLRIPAWSEKTRVQLDGKSLAPKPGTYLEIAQRWDGAHRLEIYLDIRGRIEPAPDQSNRIAIHRGPIVLAQDSRLGPVNVPVSINARSDRFIELNDEGSRDEIGQIYTLPDGTKLCPYSSAGNGFSPENNLCVWMPGAQ